MRPLWRKVAQDAVSAESELDSLIFNSEEFNVILERERYRAHRHNHALSLAVLDLGGWRDDSEWMRDVVGKLVRRIRLTDEIGWLPERRLAVLLPYTDRVGAKTFIDSMYDVLKDLMDTPTWTVYCYPDQWINADNDQETHSIEDAPSAPLASIPWQPDEPSEHATAWPSQGMKKKMVNRLDPLVVRSIPGWKRILDVCSASVLILLTSPLMILAALWIRVTSKGPVLFRQDRVGFKGKPFTLLKFRSMHVNVETNSHQEYLKELIKGDGREKAMKKTEDKKKMIPLGSLLRSSCVDELPQLFNVLRGEMSLVGPRPPIPYEAKEYFFWHASRFDTLPGLTGLWQVSGKNNLSFQEMVRLDITYIRTRSLWSDIWIMLKTPMVILAQVFKGSKKQRAAAENSNEKN